MPSQKAVTWAFGFFLLFNSLLLILNIQAHKSPSSYTFIGVDFPRELPLTDELEYVAMSLQETVRFRLNATDAIDEWRQVMELPIGRVHLGPERRLFNLAFWHQLHCVREMARVITSDDHSTPEHIMHCLHYMRQGFLCEADGGLEVGDFMMRDFEVDRVADTVVCRDWEKVYNYLEGEAAW
ncbi:hypothetical protein C8J56DRAFT_1026516 [Mycena floridula]|nr:hypothetical protein C8J56DRAFT_1026516 [Mycena floridula]